MTSESKRDPVDWWRPRLMKWPRLRCESGHWAISYWQDEGADENLHVAMFANKAEADLYAIAVANELKWEVVQWEGEQ